MESLEALVRENAEVTRVLDQMSPPAAGRVENQKGLLDQLKREFRGFANLDLARMFEREEVK